MSSATERQCPAMENPPRLRARARTRRVAISQGRFFCVPAWVSSPFQLGQPRRPIGAKDPGLGMIPGTIPRLNMSTLSSSRPAAPLPPSQPSGSSSWDHRWPEARRKGHDSRRGGLLAQTVSGKDTTAVRSRPNCWTLVLTSTVPREAMTGERSSGLIHALKMGVRVMPGAMLGRARVRAAGGASLRSCGTRGFGLSSRFVCAERSPCTTGAG